MTTPTAPDTWSSRDLPVLVDAVSRVDEQRMYGGVRIHEIAESTGLDVDTVYISARALEDAGLVEISHVMPGSHSRISAVSGTARQITGAWPSEEALADRLLAAAAAMLETDISDAERSKWQAIRDGAMYAGRDVMVQLAAMALSGRLPH